MAIVLILLAGFAASYLFVSGGRRLQLAYNVQLAAYTFAVLDTNTQELVQKEAFDILKEQSSHRMATDILLVDPDLRVLYSFYALAMMNLKIKPALKDNFWYAASNPFDAERWLSTAILRRVKNALETSYHIKFDGWVS